MNTFRDFVKWAGSTRKAAELLDTSASTVSRLATGQQRMTADVAEQVEQVSGGAFRKERVMWPESDADTAKVA